ncbi:hypothetical protein Tco_0233590 [Tanacetum coccineum]
MRDSMHPGIVKIDDYDSEGDIRFLEELLSNDSPPLPENESFSLDHFDDPSLPRPPPEPPDVEICFNFEPDAGDFNFEPDAGDFINKVVGDISDMYAVPLMPSSFTTPPPLCPMFDLYGSVFIKNEDKQFQNLGFHKIMKTKRARFSIPNLTGLDLCYGILNPDHVY